MLWTGFYITVRGGLRGSEWVRPCDLYEDRMNLSLNVFEQRLDLMGQCWFFQRPFNKQQMQLKSTQMNYKFEFHFELYNRPSGSRDWLNNSQYLDINPNSCNTPTNTQHISVNLLIR